MADGIVIRPAVPGDENALGTIGAATFLDSYIEVIPGPDIVAHAQAAHAPAVYHGYLSHTDPRYACWLAEYGATGAPVGYAVTTAVEAPTVGEAEDIELKRIYVLSRFHGTGTGRDLMIAAVQHARHMGAKRMVLGTYDQNHRAVAFYRRAGFTQIGTRQFQVGDQLFDDIVMGLDLTG